MIPQPCNGMIQVVLDTVNSVQLKMKSKLPMMTDEAREKQIENDPGNVQSQQNKKLKSLNGFLMSIDPFTNEILLTTKDWILLVLGTILIAPFRAVGVILGLVLAWAVAKIGLLGLSASEMASNVSRRGWRRKLMDWYSNMGMLIFWAAGFRISIKGRQASRSEAPILVGAPHSSFLEALIIYMCGCSPVSRYENRTAFLISACQLFYQTIFVDRRTNETRKRALEEICARAHSSDNLLPQLFVCPEGTNTNRKALIQFKIGAFAPGVPIQPVLIRYPGTERIDAVTWTYNQRHSYIFSVWYLLSNPVNRVEVEFLPVYTPSPEEKAKPELYAKNVQMVMAEALGVPAMDISYAGYYKEYCQKHNTYVEDTKKKQ